MWRRLQNASSMKEALRDLRTDGNATVTRMLNEGLDADVRIESFLQANLPKFGDKSDRDLFHVFPHHVPRLEVDHSYGYRRFDIDEYLDYLEAEAHASVEGEEADEFVLAKRASVQSHLLDYLEFLAPAKSQSASLVFLLRDTLLLNLGARRLNRHGWNIRTTGVVTNRRLLHFFGHKHPRNPLYCSLFEHLFTAIGQHGGEFDREYVERFAAALNTSNEPGAQTLVAFLRRYCGARLDPDLAHTVVETGAHGTMPLVMMAAVPSLTQMRMYTVMPWLQDFYGASAYTHKYAHMRDLEGVTCQDKLVYFDGVDGNRIIVREAQDPKIKRRAHAEIRQFLARVDARFAKLATADRYPRRVQSFVGVEK